MILLALCRKVISFDSFHSSVFHPCQTLKCKNCSEKEFHLEAQRLIWCLIKWGLLLRRTPFVELSACSQKPSPGDGAAALSRCTVALHCRAALSRCTVALHCRAALSRCTVALHCRATLSRYTVALHNTAFGTHPAASISNSLPRVRTKLLCHKG